MKSLVIREIITSVIAVILAIIVGYLIDWDFTKLVETDTIIAYFLIGGIMASLAYGWKPRLDSFFDKDKNNDKEIYKKIHTELKDGIESLNGTLDRKTIQYEIEGKKVVYKHIYMNHNVYDGLVNSGDFNQINHELQQPLQDIYGKINIHDDFVKKIVELEDNSSPDEYVLILNKYEKELLNEIPPIMEKLKCF
ncbi:MAG: hypothetical protein NPMRTH1_180002 [Nitrosopumilales archaeon]|nr:MAG: hypothetical protein NPMRTH1_180002 [Nitrosopumilales archaeon]